MGDYMKKMISYFMIIVFCFSFASCSKEKDKEKVQGTITIMAYDEYFSLAEIAKEKFKVDNEGIDINIKKLDGKVNDEELKKIMEEQCDIAILPNYTSQRFMIDNSDIFESLNGYGEGYIKDFDKNRLKNVVLQKEVKAMPIDTKPVALIYQNYIREEMKIDKNEIITWIDLENIGIKLKERGVAALGVTFNGDLSIYSLMMNQLNLDYIDEELKSTINSDESKEILKLLKRFYEEGIIKVYDNNDELLNGANKGEVFSFLARSTDLQILQNQWKENAWEIMKAPSFEPGGNRDMVVYGGNVVLMKTAKQKEIASKFMIYMTTNKEVLLEAMAKLYIMPDYKPIYKNEIFDKEVEYINNKKIYSFYESILKNATPREYNGKYSEIDNYLKENVMTIIQYDNLEDILKQKDIEINELLRK